MNTYNSAQLNKLNISAVRAAKQQTKQELLAKREHYNNQLDKMICKGIHTDLDNTLFNRLQTRLVGIRISLLNIKTFNDMVKSKVSLNKPTLSRVSLSKPALCKVSLSATCLIKTA